MALSRFSLSFVRRTLNFQFLGTQSQKIRLANVVKKRFYSTEVAPSANACGLDLLITNLTQESSVERAEISTATSVEGLRKVILRFIFELFVNLLCEDLSSLNYFSYVCR